jgi:hypothetical protein
MSERPRTPWLKVILYMPVSMLSVVGMLASMWLTPFNPIAFPFIFLFMWMAGYPIARMLSRTIHAQVEYDLEHQAPKRGRMPKRAEDMYEVPEWELNNNQIDMALFDQMYHQGGRD